MYGCYIQLRAVFDFYNSTKKIVSTTKDSRLTSSSLVDSISSFFFFYTDGLQQNAADFFDVIFRKFCYASFFIYDMQICRPYRESSLFANLLHAVYQSLSQVFESVFYAFKFWIFWPEDVPDFRPLLFMYPEVLWCLPGIKAAFNYVVTAAKEMFIHGEHLPSEERFQLQWTRLYNSWFRKIFIVYKIWAFYRVMMKLFSLF